ncbi:MAG TPA: cysteine desulfurase family protein, partial [Candidatus Saccharimonadales bacterium]|nr:cysteine desulfurase family protein [Candidatus Saccharimonadales bacterium]
MSAKTIYLDYAAATPLHPEVLAAMQPFFAERFYNPSASYAAARETRKALETARADIGHWLGARPSEVVFTAGGSEANNLAVHGVMRQFPQANLVVAGVEHDSILAPAKDYACRLAKVLPDGRINLENLAELIDDQTVLVSIGYANNEIGTIQPLKQIAQLLDEIRNDRRQRAVKQPLYFHTDACQAGNYLDLHVSRLAVDLMTINGGKLYGPKQSGVLFVKAGLSLKPLVSGGGQEFGMRSGTENVAAAIGLAKALNLAQTDRHNESNRLQQLQRQFFDLIDQTLPNAVINGSQKTRLPNNVHLTIPGQDNERLLIQLDEAGIQAAAGSACSASDEEPSHVLK